MRLSLATASALLIATCSQVLPADEITLLRTPGGGIQPVAQADAAGNVHLIYFRGDDAASGDLFYCVRRKGEEGFGDPVRVNSTADSAIAIGTIRGAQLALGRGGHVHVAWMGSAKARPGKDHHATPMLYARSTDGGKSFEPERNLITTSYGLDGGGAIAADDRGNVEVFWHAGPQGAGEGARQIWVTHSTDDGKTFAPEAAAWDQATGVCGCCGMTAGASGGKSWVMYRAATAGSHRDVYLLQSSGEGFTGQRLDQWEIQSCPMSAMSLGFAADMTAAAWEAEGGDVAFSIIGTAIGGRVAHGAVPRKFPDIALAPDGRVLVAWIDGAGWKKAGRLGWQLFDRQGAAVGAPSSRPDNASVWTKPAAVYDGDGFLIVY